VHVGVVVHTVVYWSHGVGVCVWLCLGAGGDWWMQHVWQDGFCGIERALVNFAWAAFLICMPVMCMDSHSGAGDVQNSLPIPSTCMITHFLAVVRGCVAQIVFVL
jgi:hypothetical protein